MVRSEIIQMIKGLAAATICPTACLYVTVNLARKDTTCKDKSTCKDKICEINLYIRWVASHARLAEHDWQSTVYVATYFLSSRLRVLRFISACYGKHTPQLVAHALQVSCAHRTFQGVLRGDGGARVGLQRTDVPGDLDRL
jgi:hypothetical protein